jgi:hypothetical protein
MPIVLFPYQEELIDEVWDCIVHGKKVFIEKSRQLGVTVIMC